MNCNSPRRMMLGLFSSPSPYKSQKYDELKKEALASGTLFTDPEFPPNEKALFRSGGKLSGIDWKRPKDICADPKLFVDGVSSHDVTQGEVGNCWFVAACSCLAQEKQIWSKVIPEWEEQDWNSDNPQGYAGIFHFQFWRYGEWIDIVVDDFLPTRNGKLVYVHSKSRNEFWSALLEKAYAKLFGCYEALDGGELAEALEDFTGGVAEPIDLVQGKYAEDEEKRDELFKTMKSSMDNRALMAAAIPARSSDEMEQSTDVGLVKGHAYGITAVKRVALEGTGLFGIFNQDKIPMIRLRNPWGGCEWKGAFSDGSPEWDKIDKSSREKIGLTFEDDGEFWMRFEDYCKYFLTMSICRVVNTSFFSLQKTWHESEISGEWGPPSRQGGCINNKETFLNNPQFVFDVGDKEDELLLCVTQKSGRGSDDTPDKLHIGFCVMKVEENRKYRIHKPQQVVFTSPFKNSRSIFVRHTFTKGRFVVLASTFEPGHSGMFLFRLYSSTANHSKELQLDKPEQPMSLVACLPCCRYPLVVTRVKVVRATALEKQDRSGDQAADRADPYCYIKCEGDNVYTPTCKDTLNPEFNSSVIFYRREPANKQIKVQIWNSNVGFDQFMGQYRLSAAEECERKVMEVNLTGRKSEKDVVKPGKMLIEVTTSRNLCHM